MKSKILKISLLVITVLALTVSLFACKSDPTEYTITYAAGDGATGSYQAVTCEAGATVTLPDGTALAKDGHTFDGWTDGTTSYAAGATFTMPESNVTLTAAWKANAPATYTLTYAAGEGATGSYTAGTYAAGATVTLPDGTALTKDGHTFDGWTDGTNSYAAGATFTMPASNVTLTAVWTANAPATYTLTYAAGEGATGSYTAGTYAAGATVTLPDGTALTKDGHTFGGWTDGTTSYAAGATFTMPANNVTLNAIWNADAPATYTLTYAAGDGATGSYNAGTYAAGATVTLPDGTALTKDGHTFGGWTDGTNSYAAGATFTMPADNVILTAVWNEDTTGGGDVNNNPVYTNNAGVVLNNLPINSIEYNAADGSITVTYDGTETATYTLVDYMDGTYGLSGFSNVFGSTFGWLKITASDITLYNGGDQVMATFYIGGGNEGEGGEGGDEGGNEGEGGEATDTIKTFIHTGATINGHTVTKIVYNQTQAKITVTYDGEETVTYALDDYGDGDWKILTTTIFGEDFKWITFPANDATICKLNFKGYGVQPIVFNLEGAGGDEGNGGEGGEGGNGGEDVDKTYEIVATGPYAVTKVAGNTINKIVYNAAHATLVVTYNDTETASYTLKIGTPIYGLTAWTIVETDHIFTDGLQGFLIEADRIDLYVGYDILVFEPAVSGGNEGEGGNEGGDVTTNPIYTNNEGVVINGLPINSIEYNAADGSITVTYDGTETATYTLVDYEDGTYGLSGFGNVFGSTFGWLKITASDITLYNGGEQVMATFYIGGEGGNEGGDVTTNPVYTNSEGVVINGLPINSIEYNAADGSILVTYDGTETATYTLVDYEDGTYGLSGFGNVFGSAFGCLEITASDIIIYDGGEQVMAVFYIAA